MAAGISIGIASDTRAFASGVRSGVLQPLEKVEDALEDVTRAGDDATTELVGGFKGAQRATADLERENKELANTIQREARKSSRAVRDIGDDGFHQSSEAAQGFKDEAIQNFSEVASSFDGSMQGIADGVQGTLGGLASSISGPIGLALGGIGLIAGAVGTQWSMAAEQIEEDWKEMYEDMVESGANFLSADLINRKIQEIAIDAGKMQTAYDDASEAGVRWQDVLRAQAGDTTALGDVLSSARAALALVNDQQKTYIEQNGDESAAIADKQGSLELLIEKYNRMLTAQDSAARSADAARGAMVDAGDAAEDTAGKVASLNKKIAEMPETKRIYLTADTTGIDAALERIRRDELTKRVEFDYVINERRGRTLP